MSEERQLAALAALAALQADFVQYAPKCLKIKTKAGNLETFALNKAQQYIHTKLEEQRAKIGMVRALILKGRQQGASTYIGGRFYHRASLRRGVSVFILTHEQAATDNLFNMVSRYHEHTPLRPSTGAANAKELLFNKLDSGYSVATAGQKAAGRSKTSQLFHGSEVAFWPNAKDHFASSVQTVPDEPGTEIILESTANGVGGEFYERWQKAEAGIGDYIAIFVPWYWEDGYARPVPPEFKLRSDKLQDEDVSEEEYFTLYATKGMTLENMVWRRAKVNELGPTLFKQEYPAEPDEAFQTTGHDSYIKGPDVLRARRNHIAEPLGALVVGVDPSRYGDDLFAITWRRGRKLIKCKTIEKIGTVEAANLLKQIIDVDVPAKMFIDTGGIGGGVYDVLVSFGEKYDKIAVGVNFGGEPQEPVLLLPDGSETPGPYNRRAEMYLRSKRWLQDPIGADIPDEAVWQTDAVAAGYKYDTNQRLLIESKDAMRKRGVRSPDRWDSFILTFAEPVSEVQPVKRKSNNHRRALRQKTGWMAA